MRIMLMKLPEHVRRALQEYELAVREEVKLELALEEAGNRVSETKSELVQLLKHHASQK